MRKKREETKREMALEEEMAKEVKEEVTKVEETEEMAEEIEEGTEEIPVVSEEIIKKEMEEVAKIAEKRLAEWIPKTRLGREVVEGKYKSLIEILAKGEIILEPQIVDYLVPNLKEEMIYIGGTPGKGGGIRRTPTRITARMHKSGRRFKLTAVVVVGNEDGIVGIGKASSNEHRIAIEKAIHQAKLNVINVRRGCGSWECNCGGNHSIPFKTEGKAGSVRIILMPTPVGVGLVGGEEVKKILRLAGIKDIWTKTFGMTCTRMNLAFATFEALRNLSRTKGDI
ncbi:MAG: 30S ribosomal protein S5 [Candidatus Aenigmatarchaeota archaeon]